MNADKTVRLLTDSENLTINRNKNFIKIKIDFGDEIDPSQEITFEEFSIFLAKMQSKFDKSVVSELLSVLSKIYALKSTKYGSKKITPEFEYDISFCGGCGCNPTGEPPCQVIDHACYSC